MAYAVAIVAGFAGAALGWMATGFALLVLAIWPATGLVPETVFLLNQFGAIAGLLLAAGLALRRSGTARSRREGARSSLMIAAGLAVIVAAGSNLRLDAVEHLGLVSAGRAIEFEIRLPPVVATGSSKREARVELHSDVTQTVAQIGSGGWSASDGGRAILRGTVPIEIRTSRRTLVLNMPGQPQRLFKIRLAADPGRTAEFGPWHVVDSMSSAKGDRERPLGDDNFAIRYRVI